MLAHEVRPAQISSLDRSACLSSICQAHVQESIAFIATSSFSDGSEVCWGFSRIGNLAVTSEILALARLGLCSKMGSVPMEIISSCNIHTIISLSKRKECKNRRNSTIGLPVAQ